MIDKSGIIDGLKRLGVHSGMRLEVHSSLSSFGLVAGGADAVIDAVLSVVTQEGTVIMPTFPLSKARPLSEVDKQLGIVSKKQKLSEESDQSSDMGVIADTFRCRSDVYTGKGEHRCSAWGRDASRYAEGFQHLLTDNGHALMIGVDIRALTSMHYVESGISDEVWKGVFPPANPQIAKLYPATEWFIITDAKPPYIQGWLKVQEEAYRLGHIRTEMIGKSRCMHFRVRDVVGIYEEWIHRDPFGLFGLKTPSSI